MSKTKQPQERTWVIRAKELMEMENEVCVGFPPRVEPRVYARFFANIIPNLFEVLGEALSSNKAKDAEIKRLKAVVAGYDKLIFKLSGKISIANDSKTVEIRHAVLGEYKWYHNSYPSSTVNSKQLHAHLATLNLKDTF
jgi:hypothetical protein